MPGLSGVHPIDNSRTHVVLVIGGNGFLGRYIVSALRQRDCRVLRGVRHPRAPDERFCDLAHLDVATCIGAEHGVDVVVNAAGILRENQDQTFEAVHVDGPLALAGACVNRGVRRFVQISVIGRPDDGEFIASKHRFDEQLLAMPLSSVVLRPSVVYSVSGSYGGTSLLRALAAIPGRPWLPGDGHWLLQPVAAQDLAEAVACAAIGSMTGTFEVAGPEPMSLRDYQDRWRSWLCLPSSRAIEVPEVLVLAQVWLWERIGRGPVGMTMWRMLQRGNVAAPDAWQRLKEVFGTAPRSLDDVLTAHPSQVQDRWQAQLYFLSPILRTAVVSLWAISAIAGLFASADEVMRIVGENVFRIVPGIVLARAGGMIDAVLAIWLMLGWRPRWAISLMGLSVVIYTVLLGFLTPVVWLAPLGGLAKNLVILPALFVLWVLVERR